MNNIPDNAPFAAAGLSAARADTPAPSDPGRLLHAARLAHAAELSATPVAPRWTEEFAALFGSSRCLAACSAFSLILGLGAAVHVSGELDTLAAIMDLTGPIWEVAT